MSPGGLRNFTTTVQLSHGTDIRSNKKSKVFPKLDHPDQAQEKAADFDRLDILPGQSYDEVSISKLEPQSFNPAAIVRQPASPKKKAKKGKK
jgi:hypothetical protein